LNPIAARVGCAARFRFRGERREIEAKTILLGSEKGIFVCFAKKGNSEATSRAESSQHRFKYRAEYMVIFDRFGINGLICMESFVCKEPRDKHCFEFVLPDMGARIRILYYNNELDKH
jgi:hypothetical protein